ncbi:hypothetical protein Cgig2_008846 [Carnegiea gigantea]|uniref:Uncharacterized protein n=1 Tax=Carnegiea gigantea TaxID=171969 RepID=A0A9Q1GUG0_9CARY|nr:hypothetical protein Cgig2_008846 [Carnegiea gigantea]
MTTSQASPLVYDSDTSFIKVIADSVGGGRFKTFHKRVPVNLDEMKAVVRDRHATDELSFSPARGDGRQLRQEFADSSERDAQIQNALAVLRMKEEVRAQPQPSIYQQVLTKLRMDNEEERAVDTLVLYILTGSSSQQAPSSHQRLPKMIGGESEAMFIHRVLYCDRPNFCQPLLCLKRDAFIHPANVMIVKQLLDEGCFVRATEIIVITLYIFIRGASY